MKAPVSVLIFIVAITAHAQIVPETTLATHQDSTGIQAIDSTRFRFLPNMGSTYASIDTTSILHHSQLNWTDARYLGDVLWKIPGVFLYELGETGKPTRATMLGLDSRNVPLLLNGRPLDEIFTHNLNLYDLPFEAIEQIEIVDAVDAIIYNGQGSALNLVTRQYDNNRPITKLRYMQGPFEYGLTDGLFTQNVARGTNVLIGFQRHTSDGRFINSAYDAWNIRSQVRYNYSNRLNVALNYFYNSADVGANGGLSSTSPSVFNEVAAVVMNENASESRSRHDLTLTGIAKLFSDTTNIMSFSLFYTTDSNTYRDEVNALDDINKKMFYGLHVQQQVNAAWHNAIVGLEVSQTEYNTNDDAVTIEQFSTAALFGKLQLKLLDWFHPKITARLDETESYSNKMFGVGIQTLLNEFATLTGEYSVSTSTRQYQISVNDITVSPISKNNYSNISITLSLSSEKYGHLTLTAFTRKVEEKQDLDTEPFPLLLKTTRESAGITAQYALQYGNLEIFGTGMYHQAKRNGTKQALVPEKLFTGEVAYRDEVLTNILELRTGVRVRYTSSHQGIFYNPLIGYLSEGITTGINERVTLDLFAVAHLGNAYLTLSWENVFDHDYTLISNYPMPGRTFRVGFNWTFLD